MKSSFLFLFLFSVITLPIKGQNAIDSVTSDVFILRDTHHWLPIQDLGKTYIEVHGSKALYDGLSLYTQVYSSDLDIAPQVTRLPQWHQYTDTIHIYGFELNTLSPRKLTAALDKIDPTQKNLLCLWGNHRVFGRVELADHLSTIIYSSGVSNTYPKQIAQVIMGGLSIDNKLPYTISKSFPTGHGLSNGKKIRLGYLPLSVLCDSASLLQDSIHQIVQAGIKAQAFPGAQVLVAKNGYVVYHSAFGYHTYDSLTPVKLTDIYDLASVTKITAGMPPLMKLYDEQKFELDKPLQQYVPYMAKSNKGDKSMRSILAHNAQMKSWIAYWTTAKKKNGKWRGRTIKPDSTKKYTVKLTDDMWLHYKYKQKIYKMIKKSPLNPEPGYVYSGLLFYLIPDMVEQISQTSFTRYLKEEFYFPLGSYTITHNPHLAIDLAHIIPTERDTFFRMKQLHGVVHDEGAAMMGGVSSNAGLFTSTNDLAKLAQMYLQYGQYGNQQYIQTETFKEFTRCQYCEQDNRRGLGFERPMITYDPEKSHVAPQVSDLSFGHSGYTGTFVWIDPKYELVYLFMSNRVYPTRLNRKLYEMNIRPRIQSAIYQAFGISGSEH